MAAYNVLFVWKEDSLAFGLWRCCLFLVLILCIDKFVWKISWLLIMRAINESVYCHGTVRPSTCLNRLLMWTSELCTGYKTEDFLLLSENLPTVRRITPQCCSIFYNGIKVCIVKWKWFYSVNITDMDQWPDSITCSTSFRNHFLHNIQPIQVVFNM